LHSEQQHIVYILDDEVALYSAVVALIFKVMVDLALAQPIENLWYKSTHRSAKHLEWSA